MLRTCCTVLYFLLLWECKSWIRASHGILGNMKGMKSLIVDRRFCTIIKREKHEEKERLFADGYFASKLAAFMFV